MSRKPRFGSGVLLTLGAVLLLSGIVALAVPVLTCPRCDGDAAVGREVFLRAGRGGDAALLCRVCEADGRVTLVQCALFRFRYGGYGPPPPDVTIEPVDR